LLVKQLLVDAPHGARQQNAKKKKRNQNDVLDQKHTTPPHTQKTQ
jgi:hypothetical protein